MKSDSTAIRVGLIGYGFSGKTFHAPLIRATPGLELTVVASRDPDKVQADIHDLTVISDPMQVARSDMVDLLVVATPNDSHAPIARAALEAGKHVVIDKPFTLDLASARELIALADSRGVLLSVFHNRRWDSDFLSIKKVINDGLIGTVTHFESHIDRFRPEVRVRWREQGGPGSGLWFDIGPHLVDQALQLFGLPRRVQGNLARQRLGAVSDDWAHAVLDYEERRVILHAGLLTAGGSYRFVAHGEGGSVVKQQADRQEDQLRGGMKPGDPGWGNDPDPVILFDGSGASRMLPSVAGDQRHYYKGVVDALKGIGRTHVTSLQALGVMAVMEAVIESARMHAAVELALEPEERAIWI
ncbi:oxidoreductase [Beijerinckia mobilis]|uniref:oxidoreductase n=1 Tax=Beijerinckia mobilis TaxID=231434 RepID=UPI000557E7CC|nr:oxidoreductase [Beijerinckia mobilis]